MPLHYDIVCPWSKSLWMDTNCNKFSLVINLIAKELKKKKNGSDQTQIQDADQS